MAELAHIILIMDNSIFSAEQDAAQTRLGLTKKLVACILEEMDKNYLLTKTTIISSSQGVPKIDLLSTSSIIHAVSVLSAVEADSFKFDLFKALLLAGSIHSSGQTVFRSVVFFLCCSPIFSDNCIIDEDQSSMFTSSHTTINTVSLCGDIHVLKQLSKRTGGVYYALPPDLSAEDTCAEFTLLIGYKQTEAALIPIGIAQNYPSDSSSLLENGLLSKDSELKKCPRCGNAVDKIPAECGLCRLIISNGSFTKRQNRTYKKSVAKTVGICAICYYCGIDRVCDYKCTDCSRPLCTSCNTRIDRFWGSASCCAL